MLFLVLVEIRAGSGVAGFPEKLDEVLALLIVCQKKKLLPFLALDDVGYFLVDPVLEPRREILRGIDRIQRVAHAEQREEKNNQAGTCDTQTQEGTPEQENGGE
jgi:hypothetical protein